MGLVFRCAALLLLLGFQVDVGLQLALQIVFQIPPPKQQRQLGSKPVPHVRYSSPDAGLITNAIALASCFHFDSSEASCFLPVFVRR